MTRTIMFLILCSTFVFGANERQFYDKFLFLNEEALEQLREEAARQEAHFLACTSERVFRAQTQARVDFFDLRGTPEDFDGIDTFLKQNPSVQSFQERYGAFVDKAWPNSYVTRTYDQDPGEPKEAIIGFPRSSYRLRQKSGEPLFTAIKVAKTWQILGDNTYEQNKKRVVTLVRFRTDFQTPVIPERYNHMINYANCMINPHVKLFHNGPARTGDRAEAQAALDRFVQLTAFPEPEFEDDVASEVRSEVWSAWFENKEKHMRETVVPDPAFLPALEAAAAGALVLGRSEPVLDEYALKFLPGDMTLELLRLNQLMGGCSMDESPRIQATMMANLAAETGNWDVYLRSHLNLLNDRFSRVSDNSLAENQRQTHLSSLEDLGLNVLELMLGTGFTIQKDNEPGRYRGSVRRSGRALTEMSDREQAEAALEMLIFDEELDLNNRLGFLMINIWYLNHTPREEAHFKGAELLEKLASSNDFLRDLVGEWYTVSFEGE